jgi:hypothetical protein
LYDQQPAGLARVGGRFRGEPQSQDNCVTYQVVADVSELDSQRELNLVSRSHKLSSLFGFEPGLYRWKLLQTGEQAGRCEGVKLVAKVFNREDNSGVRRYEAQRRVERGIAGSSLSGAG